MIEHEELITHTIKVEEERFLETLSRGMSILTEASEKCGDTFPGETAFKLYDTFGFPLDLTADVLKPMNKSIDMKAYDACMKEQKDRSRAAWSGTGDSANEKIWFDIKAEIGPTEFVGYTNTKTQGIVKAIAFDDQMVEKAHNGQKVWIITNQTPFYGESGGQEGDTGKISTDFGTEIEVLDTVKKAGDLYAHLGILENGDLSVGETVHMAVHKERRDALKRNHSATHLLHSGLRRYLGSHITQKGSLVAPDRLRFDFSHTIPLSEDELKKVEIWVNTMCLKSLDVTTEILPPEKAKEKGAMALFGEKYGDLVRVVTMGDKDISIELCGGTHVKNTGEIGAFKILSEASIASGVRRIEAVTGLGVFEYIDELKYQVTEAEQKALKQYKEMKKEIESYQKQLLTMHDDDIVMINNVKVFAKELGAIDQGLLRQKITEILQKHSDTLVIFMSKGEKISCVIGVGDQLKDRFDARKLAQKASDLLGGKGWRRPTPYCFCRWI